jgi:hypothetical protein
MGFRPWGIRSGFGEQIDYYGWQRVSLPSGWSISFEGRDLLLLDERDRVRGHIYNALALRHIPPRKGSLGAAISEGLKKAFASKKRKRAKKSQKRNLRPQLVLRPCLIKRSSFTLDPNGPYTYWVEDPFGKRVFQVEVRFRKGSKNKTQKLKEAPKRLDKWLAANYESWKNPLAYWHKPEFQ